MSKPRYGWWSYVKWMIKQYPDLRERCQELHSQSVTANYSGMPRSGGNRRTVESAALKELPAARKREYEAVRQAIEETKRHRNGAERMKVIELVYWHGSCTLDGAALAVPCGVATARRWHGEFIRLVASHYGLMDD